MAGPPGPGAGEPAGRPAAGTEGRQDRLKLVSELAQLFFVRGQLSEGKLHFDRVLAENPEPSRDRVIALAQSAELALSEGRLDDAARAAHEALPHARRSADERSESLALRVLAVEQFRRNPSDRAHELLLTSRNIARKGGRPWSVGMVDIYLGDLAEVRGRYDEARQWYESAELTLREAGNTWGHTWALRALGNFLLHQNQFEQADQRLRESLALARHLNSRQFVVLALHDLGNTAYRRDEQGWAAHWYEEAMTAMDRLDEQTTLCQCRASMAKVCVARQDLGGARGGGWAASTSTTRCSGGPRGPRCGAAGAATWRRSARSARPSASTARPWACGTSSTTTAG